MWQVTLARVDGIEIPTDDAGFLEFAKSLPDPTMYEALKESIPITTSELETVFLYCSQGEILPVCRYLTLSNSFVFPHSQKIYYYEE